MPITQINKTNNNKGQIQSVLILIEYLSYETTEKGRQDDLMNNKKTSNYHQFSFNCNFGPKYSQKNAHEEKSRSTLLNVFAGYYATVLAYGQTGTGKTYTIKGLKYSSTYKEE